MNYQANVLFETTDTYSCLSLHKCVGHTIDHLGTYKVVNDIYPGLFVSTHKDTLTETLSLLLSSIAVNNPGCSMHLTAKLVGNITLLHIKSNDAKDFSTITKKVSKLESLARSIGGCVTISSNDIYGLAVAFTFRNH